VTRPPAVIVTSEDPFCGFSQDRLSIATIAPSTSGALLSLDGTDASP
jgi:hypothetical protein